MKNKCKIKDKIIKTTWKKGSQKSWENWKKEKRLKNARHKIEKLHVTWVTWVQNSEICMHVTHVTFVMWNGWHAIFGFYLMSHMSPMSHGSNISPLSLILSVNTIFLLRYLSQNDDHSRMEKNIHYIPTPNKYLHFFLHFLFKAHSKITFNAISSIRYLPPNNNEILVQDLMHYCLHRCIVFWPISAIPALSLYLTNHISLPFLVKEFPTQFW